MKICWHAITRIVICATLLANVAPSQTVTGTITGTVMDSSDQVIPGAAVTLTNESTGDTRTMTTNETGDFRFLAINPGTYTIKVEMQGFRQLQRTGNVLTANERLSVGELRLAIGTVSEAITVTAQGAAVQTSSSETSALLTSKQLEMVAVRGRDVISMLRILPGVSQAIDTEAVGGNFGTQTPNIQGTRSNWNSVSVDGLTGNDLGSPGTFASPINLDAIGEVKVLLNNYQAEYGRNGSASVNIITKSGSREFHGSAYAFKRHEQFNANNFFNNRSGLPKPIYRYTTLGATLGGPVFIPKLMEGTRDKLFFFYSYENVNLTDPQAVRQVTTPSALERAGDFSQSLDTSGKVIPIIDPTTGKQFPDNKITADRINTNGLAILNLFPLPNSLNRAITKGNYNYEFQESIGRPKHQNLFRFDYHPTQADSVSLRGDSWYADSTGYAVSAGSSNWGLVRQHYTYTDDGLVLAYTHVFSPTVVNEFTAGARHSTENGPPVSADELNRVVRSSRGITLGQLYSGTNALNVIPQASFGGVTGAAAITYDGRFPVAGADTVFNFNDSIAINRGTHALKAGLFVERLRNYEGAQGTFGGNFDFSRDTANPLDTGYAYSNALIGNFKSYTESSSRPSNEGRKSDLGWFVQDNWKITRKLTLDYGVRFTWYTQWRQDTGKAAAFALERYTAAKARVLYLPVKVGTTRRAINPLTGEIFPAVLIGGFVPGSGDPVNGAVTAADPNYPAGFIKQQPMLPEPRFGFAYDVFGNGKTAVRSSFGIFHNTVSPGVRAFTQNPPVQFNPSIFYGNLDTFLSTPGTLFPSNTRAFDVNSKTPSLYSYTFGVQQDVGFATVLDVAYVGSVSRHLQDSRNINIVPYGARFLPQNADPSNPSTPLNDNFFRPYPGWGSITYTENAVTANYNALQVQVNRRFAHGFQFGVAYTWSKAMDYVDSDGDAIAMYRPIRIWNYGKAGFDQTHVFVANYTWELPKGSRLLPSRISRVILDNWQISGITTFASGTPAGVTFTTVDGADLSGGGDGTRINVTGKAELEYGERTFDRFFNTSVFARPAKGDPGNAPKDVYRDPGRNNWDISMFKDFPVTEGKYFQLRWETYNTFNHTQFATVDNTARFDATGNQVNARFGQVISARPARLMQASLRFRF